MPETYKGQKMMKKAEEIQEFWAYDLKQYNGSLVKTQNFNKLCLLLSCLNIRNTSINFRWSFVS